jgi:hypothetical protein
MDGVNIDNICEDDKGNLPSLNELNAKIDQKLWGEDLNGRPKPPWQLVHIIYLRDHMGACFTSLNSTWGQAWAFRTLKDQIDFISDFHKVQVIAVVELGNKPMTKFNKLKLWFRVAEFRQIGNQQIAPMPVIDTKAIGSPINPPTTSRTLGRGDIPSIHCISYCVDDGAVDLWVPGDPVPCEWVTATNNTDWVVSAFNDSFETAIERHILAPRYGFPLVPIERHRCLQSVALSYGLPAKLEKAAEALKLPFRKASSTIMRKWAKPRKAPRHGFSPTIEASRS